MEEHEIIRTDQFINIPIEVVCVKIDNGYRIKTYSPLNNLLTGREIEETGVPFSEHPLLRPFDRFLLEGYPDIGKISHIFIFDQETNLSAIVFSIVETKKRILILPAWGRGLMKPLANQDVKELSSIAHITIEKKGNKKYEIHFTESSKKKKTRKFNYPPYKLNMKDRDIVFPGKLKVNDLKNLDPLGIVYRDLKDDDLKPIQRYDIKEMEQILQEALSQNHRLYKLPPEFNWDNENHLEISFALSENDLEEIRWQIYKSDEVPFIEQTNKIQIDWEENLFIRFTMGKGKLKNTFVWSKIVLDETNYLKLKKED